MYPEESSNDKHRIDENEQEDKLSQGQQSTTDIDQWRKNCLVKSVHSRCGNWVDPLLKDKDFVKLRYQAREFYNFQRYTALAQKRIFVEDIILSYAQADLLKEKHAKAVSDQ